MFGLFDNNIGLHKNRIIMRPAIEHIEIVTNNSLFELAFSAFHHMLHRSIFALGRVAYSVLESQFQHFYQSVISVINSYFLNSPSFSVQNPFFFDLLDLLAHTP